MASSAAFIIEAARLRVAVAPLEKGKITPTRIGTWSEARPGRRK
jgi:hypothetical protein